MIFVDTNVVMYAVGRPHPLKEEARAFFEAALRDRLPLEMKTFDRPESAAFKRNQANAHIEENGT